MNKTNYFSLIWVICFTVLTLTSCIKDPEKGKVEANKSQLAQIQSREGTPSLFVDGHIVPTNVAKALAQKINLTVSEIMRVGASTSVRTVDSLYTISDSLGIPVIYIVNYTNGGYIVISADDRHEPICALTEQGRYEVAEVPSMLLEWLEITCENVLLARSGVINNSQFAYREWIRVIKDIGKEEYFRIEDDCCPKCPNYPECLIDPNIECGLPGKPCEGNSGGGGDPCAPYVTTTKGPLMTTKWNQGCTYNEQCPDKDCNDVCYSNENAWTGCVATAMAQILRYWAHPCSQAYNYTTMPNNSGNSGVQRMMKDVGDAVDMAYGCDGSSADGGKTDNAFKDDFCYSSATYSSYGSSSYQTVMQDIDANRPVLLDGCSTRKRKFPWLWYTYSTCHMWVCDGYEERHNSCSSTLKFHMNWGWGGSYNGWFYYDNWTPSSYNFQYAQDFTHNIHP